MGKLLINEPPLQVLPTLAVRVGLNEAIFLQQLHYLLLKSPRRQDGQKWVFKTYEEWGDHFPFWSARTIRRAAKSLERQGLVICPKRQSWDQRKFYTIDYAALEKLEKGGQSGHIEAANLDASKRPGRTIGSGQSDPFILHENKENTHEDTHTHGAMLVRVGSRFSKEICRRYADHLKATGQGIKNPAGYAKTIFKTGEDDDEIAAWLESEELRERRAPYGQVLCPACGRSEPCAEPLCDFPVEKLGEGVA